MSTVRTVAKNTAMILVSTLAVKLLALVYAVYVVRYLGTADYGKYAFVFSLMTAFTLLANMGLDAVVVMDTAKAPASGHALLRNANLLKSAAVCAAWALLAAVFPLFGKGRDVVLGAAAVAFCLLPDAALATFKSFFSGHERMEFNTFLEVFYRVVFVGLGLTAVALKSGLSVFFFVPAAASLAALTAAALVYRKFFPGRAGEALPGHWRGLADRGLPFMLAGLLVYTYRGLDTVIISMARGDSAVGLFSSARALTDSFLFLPAAIAGALLPAFSRISGQSRESLRAAYEMSFKLLLLGGFLLAAAVTVLARDVVQLVYGPAFLPAAQALRVLTWSTGLAFLNIIMTTVLSVLGRQREIAAVVLVMAVLSVLLNLALIPRFGILAAAWTAVVTEGIGVVLCGRLVRAHLAPAGWGAAALKSALSGGAFCLAAAALRSFGALPALTGAAAAFLGCAYLLGVLAGKEKAVLKSVFSRRTA